MKSNLKKVRFKRLKKLKNLVFKKSLIGSIIFAVSLWGYTTLNGIFTTVVQIPFQIKLPETRAIENPLPSEISVEVKGSGWQLFHLLAINTSVECLLDLSDETSLDSAYNVSRADLIKGIRNLNLVTLDVTPNSMVLETGVVGEYVVPIVPDIIINPREGFTVVGNIELKPNAVLISGNEALVRNVSKWLTQRIVIDDVYEPFTIQIPLSDSLSNVLRVSQNHVIAKVDIQQTAEKTIYDIDSKITGGSIPTNHTLLPHKFNVTLRGGVNKIADLEPEDVSVAIEFKDIIYDSTGIIKPKVTFPKGFELVSVSPNYIYHITRHSSYKNYITQKTILMK